MHDGIDNDGIEQDKDSKRIETGDTGNTGLLRQIQHQTGIDPLYCGSLIVIGIFCLLFGAVGADRVCGVIAFVYPTYACFKTLNTNDKYQHIHWLKYWIVLGCYLFGTAVTDYTVYWFPYYVYIKVILLLWILLPPQHGTEYVFNRVINPMCVYGEKHADYTFEKMVQFWVQWWREVYMIAQDMTWIIFGRLLANIDPAIRTALRSSSSSDPKRD